MMHLRARTEIGTLVMINLQWIQLHAGISTPFMESKAKIPYIKNWFSGLREFLIKIQGSLIIKDIVVPQLERRDDRIIMEDVPSLSTELSANQLQYINNWRLYFQVQTLSDLTNAKGDRILPIYLKYPSHSDIRQARTDRTSKFVWPYQLPPLSKATFKLWVNTLRVCFMSNTGSNLRKRLGAWITTANSSQSIWQSYINSTYTKMIVTTNQSYAIHDHVVSKTSCTTTFSNISQHIDNIPDYFFPVTTVQRGQNIVPHHEKIRIILAQKSSHPLSHDIQYAIQHTLSPSDKIFLQHFRIFDTDKLLTCLKDTNCNMIMVADGSHLDDKGSFGVAVGTDQEDLYHHEGPAPYTEEHTTPFRSEAYGLLASLKFFILLMNTYQIKANQKKVSVYCDNIEIIKWINAHLTQVLSPRIFLQHDADVVTHILFEIKTLQRLGIVLTFSHVKGHQDRHNPYESLSRPAQLNVQAHNHAQNYRRQGRSEKYWEFSNNPVSLSICNRLINEYFKTNIRNASRSPDIRQYMIKKFEWDLNVPDLIWWQIHGSTIQLLSHPDKRRIRKYIFRNGCLPVNE